MKTFLTEETTNQLTNKTTFSTDGPSVMVGKNNEVVALLKRNRQNIIKCTLHEPYISVCCTGSFPQDKKLIG